MNLSRAVRKAARKRQASDAAFSIGEAWKASRDVNCGVLHWTKMDSRHYVKPIPAIYGDRRNTGFKVEDPYRE